ncbi:MAG: hypothetical protein JW888_00385 [Pirellulales bacterium]|nr:hypothetical protein [Pirellulales bacterium]
MEFDLAAYVSRNNRLVLHELQQTLEPRLASDDVSLDFHEERVMRALGFALAGAYTVLGVDLEDTELTPKDRMILELTLALHDVGKRADLNVPHPEAGYELLRDHQADLCSAIDRHVVNSKIVPSPTEDDHLQLILWLVRHHDVLEGLWTGERRAVHLDRISDELCRDCEVCKDRKDRKRCADCQNKVAKALELLLIVTLCDSIGHAPKDVTQATVDFWHKIIAMDNRGQFGDLSHRITQWTTDEKQGRPAGSPAQQAAADELGRKMNQAARDVFASHIGHIVHGFGLFKALDVRWKIRLFNMIGDCYAHHFENEEVALTFAMRYDPEDPGAARVLTAYESAIQSGRLRIVAHCERKEIRVARP